MVRRSSRRQAAAAAAAAAPSPSPSPPPSPVKRSAGKARNSATTAAAAKKAAAAAARKAAADKKKAAATPKKKAMPTATAVADVSDAIAKDDDKKKADELIVAVSAFVSETLSASGYNPDGAAVIIDPVSGLHASFMANQVHTAGGSNNNKFYSGQAIKLSNGSVHSVVCWGRVGNFMVRNSMTGSGIGLLKNKFKAKTGYNWDSYAADFLATGDSPEGKNKKYTILDLQYEEEDMNGGDSESESEDEDEEPCVLPARVQEFVELITDQGMLTSAVASWGIKLDELPLGRLQPKTITKAEKVLAEIENLINKGATTQAAKHEIHELSDKFYTLIPVSCGMSRPPTVNSLKEVKKHSDSLDALAQISFGQEILAERKKSRREARKARQGLPHPTQQAYDGLKADLRALDKDGDDFKMVERYVKQTHGHTHTYYDLVVHDVIAIDREGSDGRFEPFKDMEEKELLWHGSGLANWGSIITQGLRIAPPEAPCTGYMFGKGIYLANSVSKSANYTRANKDRPRAVLALCEVGLGKPYKKERSEFVTHIPKGKMLSTWGMGRTFPDPKENEEKIFPGSDVPCIIPCGNMKTTTNPALCLQYDEKIVYQTKQVRMRYIVVLDYKFTGYSVWG